MEEHSAAADLPREKWDTWDPMLISEGLFSAANIFSSLKLVYIFSVNPHLGPLQVSLKLLRFSLKFYGFNAKMKLLNVSVMLTHIHST